MSHNPKARGHVNAIRAGDAEIADYIYVLSKAIPDDIHAKVDRLRSEWGEMGSTYHRDVLEHWMECLEAISLLRQSDELDSDHVIAHNIILLDLDSVLDELQGVGVKIPAVVTHDVQLARMA
jgi:hypothetical protein